MDYLEVRSYFESNRHCDGKSRRCNLIFHEVEEFINSEHIKMFYPKNLFMEDKELEVYIFLEGKILRARVLEGKNIELKILYFKYLKDFVYECIYDGGEYYHKLILNFTSDEVVFNKLEDTNSSWGPEFEEQIKNIAKLLISANIT